VSEVEVSQAKSTGLPEIRWKLPLSRSIREEMIVTEKENPRDLKRIYFNYTAELIRECT
jgi:hypothetical protein